MPSGKELSKLVLIVLLGLLIGCSLFKKKDKIPPTVDITIPQDSIWFNGSLSISVTAYDSIGVESVLVYGDDALIGSDTSEPYDFTWQLANPTPFSWHSIYAKAYDKAQNEGVSTTLNVFYVGKSIISVYHGITTIFAEDYFHVKISIEANDSLYGQTLVNDQDSITHFYLMDNSNFDYFRHNENFTPWLEINNFHEFETSFQFHSAGTYHFVWQNLTNQKKLVWIRFYLVRP